MRPSDDKCRIKAVQLGEAQVNLIRPDQVPLRAKFALLAEDGSACGYFEKANGWSDRALEKLQELAGILEEDALAHVFEVPAGGSDTPKEKAEEPPQF